MPMIKELRIYNGNSQFVYEVGKQALQHDHKEVRAIVPMANLEMGKERFCVHLEDDSYVTWNAGNVAGFRVGYHKEKSGGDNVTD